jgi:hypothetical protein
VTRTEVATTRPADPRRRTERSGFSGKLVTDATKVTIEIERVRGFDDPQTKATNTLDLARGDVVTVIGRGYHGWLLVEHKDGGVGWIPATAVSDAGKFLDDPRQTPDEVAKAPKVAKVAKVANVQAAPVALAAKPVEPRPARPWLHGTLLATAGAQTFKMQQSGEGDPKAVATGGLATIAAGAQARVRGELWVGLGTTAELGTADLTYYGAEQSAPMSSHEVAVDAYAELGWGGARHIAVRGGVHYATLSVKSDRDEPMLLGERIAGATAGLGGALPLGRHLSLSAAVDVMPVGAQQLSRLPPGTLYATAVRGAWARATLAMPLPAHLIAGLSYRFGALTAQLTDNGMIPKTATRTDQSHMVTAGVGVIW